jgi:hypothetical protein
MAVINDIAKIGIAGLGKAAGETKLADSGTLAFSDVDINDDHSVTAIEYGTPLGNESATATADTSNGAALDTLPVSLIANTTNGTGASLSWTSPSILAQWSILRAGKNRSSAAPIEQEGST